MFGDLWRFETPKSSELDWFSQALNEFFPRATADIRSMPRGAFPMLNVGRTDDTVFVYVFAPGLTAEALEVSIQDDVLTLLGRRGAASLEGEQHKQRPYYRQERFEGEFARSITLPEGVDTERAEARAHDGLVEIRLPKREEVKPRRVEVKAA